MRSTLGINFLFITSKLDGRASFEVDAALAAIKRVQPTLSTVPQCPSFSPARS
jgi:hypothetical protein